MKYVMFFMTSVYFVAHLIYADEVSEWILTVFQLCVGGRPEVMKIWAWC